MIASIVFAVALYLSVVMLWKWTEAFVRAVEERPAIDSTKATILTALAWGIYHYL